MEILKRLLGSGDTIEKGFELIDSLHTSDEEEIRAKSRAKTDLLSAYQPFKVAQRYLAIIFATTFVASYIMVLILYFNNHSTVEVTTIIEAFNIDWIMTSIVLFYFGGGAFEGMINARKVSK